MATRTKPTAAKRQVKAPQQRREPRSRSWRLVLAAAVGLVLGGGALYVFSGGGSPGTSEGLPRTPDYHSLLVAPDDPLTLVLGTHHGLYRSVDGGLTWAPHALDGHDAMNLARSEASTVWAAGHLVFARSDDDGETWTDLRPDSLPTLDLHGFAVDPREPGTLYVAAAGAGLFRSDDAGTTFELVTDELGGAVMGLAVTPEGHILAGDAGRGLLESSDGGQTWRGVLQAAISGIAVNPQNPNRILATGPGVYLSTNGGRSWRLVLEHDAGLGPVAWSASDALIGYAVGFDRVLLKTTDGGEHWAAVVER